jgi:hypothetical protein
MQADGFCSCIEFRTIFWGQTESLTQEAQNSRFDTKTFLKYVR